MAGVQPIISTIITIIFIIVTVITEPLYLSQEVELAPKSVKDRWQGTAKIDLSLISPLATGQGTVGWDICWALL
jgi:hypothetical protein